MDTVSPRSNVPSLGIRKRFALFSAAWLVLCTVLLTAYLISQARETLLEIAVQHAQSISSGLAKDAALYLDTGDERALGALLIDSQRQPDIMATSVEQGTRVWGIRVARLDVLKTLVPERPGSNPQSGTRLVRADDRRAIEVRQPIWSPSPSAILTDRDQTENSAGRDPSGYVVVTVSVERVFHQMDALVTKSMLFWGLVLGLGLSFGWWLSGMMVSPLKRLAHNARSLTTGETEAISPPRPNFTVDDEIRSVWSSLTAMKHELDRKTSELVRLQGSMEDTVKQQTADLEEMNRRLGEVLELKNELLLHVSHEIKTPLTALSALVSNLRDGVVGVPTPRQREYYERAMAITTHVRRLLTTLLEFAMAETGKIHLTLRPVEVLAVAREALNALQPLLEEKAVTCVIEPSLTGKWVVADSDRIQQILLNLIHNAVKASPPRSTVTVGARLEAAEVIVSIRDVGPGIPAADRATLLKQPVSPGNRLQGSGVGLYICRYLVELHGGRIWFETDAGKGTTFYFSLPHAQVPAATVTSSRS